MSVYVACACVSVYVCVYVYVRRLDVRESEKCVRTTRTQDNRGREQSGLAEESGRGGAKQDGRQAVCLPATLKFTSTSACSFLSVPLFFRFLAPPLCSPRVLLDHDECGKRYFIII